MNSHTTQNSNEWSEMKKKGKCPNQYVGTLAEIEQLLPTIQQIFPVRNDVESEEGKEKTSHNKIILVLESPHIYEYEDQNPKPANRITGRNIMKYITSLVKSCLELKLIKEKNAKIKDDEIEKEYINNFRSRELCLINPIPYQCSLGNKDKKEKDRRFKELWTCKQTFKKVSDREISGENYFKETLKNLYQSGDIIINCCTSSPSKNPTLQELVQKAIDNIVREENAKFISTHPCSWKPHSSNNKNKNKKIFKYVCHYNCKKTCKNKDSCKENRKF